MTHSSVCSMVLLSYAMKHGRMPDAFEADLLMRACICVFSHYFLFLIFIACDH